jgi:hypothetical protein
MPYGGTDDLVATADCVADTDVLQVAAVFGQYEAAEDSIMESHHGGRVEIPISRSVRTFTKPASEVALLSTSER